MLFRRNLALPPSARSTERAIAQMWAASAAVVALAAHVMEFGACSARQILALHLLESKSLTEFADSVRWLLAAKAPTCYHYGSGRRHARDRGGYITLFCDLIAERYALGEKVTLFAGGDARIPVAFLGEREGRLWTLAFPDTAKTLALMARVLEGERGVEDALDAALSDAIEEWEITHSSIALPSESSLDLASA